MRHSMAWIRVASFGAVLLALGCLPITVGKLMTVASAAWMDGRKLSHQMDDRKVQDQLLAGIRRILRERASPLQNRVEVIVHEGVALLVGQVESLQLAEEVGAYVIGTQKVRKLYNEIRKEKKIAPLVLVRDAQITMIAAAQLVQRENRFVGMHLICENSELFVISVAMKEAQKERLLERLGNLHGLHRIIFVETDEG